MTAVPAFLRELADRDIRISLKGERLQISAAEGALTDQLRSDIASRKAEIIAYLRETLEERTSSFELQRVPRDRALPLSFAQQRLWFLHQLNPNDSVYNLGVSLRLPGIVDPDAVRRSLDTLAQRHEILRTIFREDNGVPAQIVTEQLPPLAVVDITDVPDDKKATRVFALGDAEVKRPFSLTESPPLRVTLIHVTPEISALLIVIHHILADGWSLGVIVREFNTLYEEYRTGKTAEIPEISWQYADYAYSEQRWSETTDQQQHVVYWKKKLLGSPSTLDLPFDRSPGRVLGSRGAVHSFTIPAPLASQLRALSRKFGVTLFTLMLSVFKTLLYRYSGQSDIVVGTPIANRKRVELESLIGLFVSTIVLRTDLSSDPSFRDLIRRVHDNVLDAHEHQDYPFEKLVDLVRPDRSLAQSPLFQTAFILHNTPLTGTYTTISGGAMFELSLYLWDGSDDIPASFEYNADLFDASTIARMEGHLLTLAAGVVDNPDRALSELPVLTPAERVQLIDQWNETQTDYPRQSTVHTLFEQQCDATPDAVALIVPDDGHIVGEVTQSDQSLRLTYRELDCQANQFAHYLQQLGIQPNMRVGVAIGRSAEFVIAILATLKCGAAYVPVDPSLPPDRLASMIDDADASVVLISSRMRSQGFETPSFRARVVSFDDFGDQQDTLPESRPTLGSSADALAYVMYTSGSTGIPKGVAVPHRAIVRLVRNTNYVTLTADDVILACAPVSFDASTFEIWGALLNGGRLVVYPRAIPEPPEIARLIRVHGVTTLWLTAGLFHLMAETQPDGFRGLRQLLAGGDVLSPVHVRKALRALDGGACINGYGPTENTTFTCCHRMTDERDVGDTVPIGRPISNTRVYLLDSHMHPVPVGVRGELWTSGDGLARGYLNDSALTAARFRPDPFSNDPNAKIYRTGDVVRYRADGVIEFLGRTDNQVKIRGFRIEPGEVEQALRDYPGVTDAVVVVRTSSGGQKQLVGYVVAREADLAISDVKRTLQQRLPSYAIPAALVQLDAFPLTPNGKVDYNALPEPVRGTHELADPQSPLEAQLLAIWEDVLGVTGISRTDNFFDVGGNSLLALQLLAKLEPALGKRVPVTVLFQSQTVEAMAAALSEELEDSSSRVVPLIHEGNRPPVFIVPGVNGNVIGYEKLAQALGPDQPVYGIRSVGLDGEATPLNQVEAIASNFISDIQRVQPHGPYYLVGFCMGGIITYEIAQQLSKAGERVELLALIDTWPPVTIPKTMWATRLGQQVLFVAHGVARHLRTLWKQPRGQRLQYLKQKFGIVREMITQRDVYRGEHAVMYSDLVTSANQHAAANYRLAPYPGSAYLFLIQDRSIRSYKEDPRLSWRTIIQEGCSIIPVAGTDSGALLRPPFVQGLADHLRALLDTALAQQRPSTSVAADTTTSNVVTPSGATGCENHSPESLAATQ